MCARVDEAWTCCFGADGCFVLPVPAMIPDRMHQGMLNALSMMVLMRSGLADDPALSFNNRSVVNTTQRNYYGNRCVHWVKSRVFGLASSTPSRAVAVTQLDCVHVG